LLSNEFFAEADKVLYEWNAPLHTQDGRFGRIFEYDRYRGKQVLEVGCGMGCMAMNWAQHQASVTAVDLNPVAVHQTKRRFELFGVKGQIREADGEQLPFDDATFDFAYSWGVLHHSPETWRSIRELYRVLKPGGRVGVMLYHRNSFLFRYQVQFIEGFLNMESHFLSAVELGSRYGDGERKEGNPHTWPVTKTEVYRDLFPQFADTQVHVLGTDVPWMLDHWLPRLGTRWTPKSWIRALARRYGWSLWITAAKPLSA
jgi:ubiquinone/menaquinone biosynthesis C-methylase UbiE